MTTRAERGAHWRRHVEQHAASGLSARAYAERHDLKVANLYAARKRLGVAVPRAVARLELGPARVARVVVAEPTRGERVHCRLHLPGGSLLEMELSLSAMPRVFAMLECGA